MTGMEKLRFGLHLSGIAMLLSDLFYRSWIPGAIAILPACVLLLPEKKKRTEAEVREEMKREFLSAAGFLRDYLKSGYSAENAIGAAGKELLGLYGQKSRIFSGWQRMTEQIRLNQTAEEVFLDFSERSQIPEIMDFAQVFAMEKRNGGQLCEVIGSAAEILSEQFSAREQILTTTAARRAEQKIMDLMPLGILCYVRIASPELLEVLYSSTAGRLVMTGCLILYGTAYILARAILRKAE